MKTVPSWGSGRPRPLGLGEGAGEVPVDAHHFAGGFHLRAQQDIDAGEPVEGEHGLLDRHMIEVEILRHAEAVQVSPAITRAAIFATGSPVALATKGTVRLARGFTSSR